MKKLFYVEQDQVLRNGLTALTKTSSWELYVLDSMKDFDFRFKDFTPDLLLVSVTLCNKRLDVDAQIPVVYLGFPEDFTKADFLQDQDFKMVKPIQVSKILSQLEEFLGR